MRDTIVLFHSGLDTLDLFSTQLQLAFEDIGYNTHIFDLCDSVISLGKLYPLIEQDQIKAAVAFNCSFLGLELSQDINLWEQFQIPTINILVDHPYWYRKILEKAPTNGIVLCVDRNHMQFIQDYYPHISTVGMLPHGGVMSESPIKPISNRSIDVLYAGSLLNNINNPVPDFSKWDFPAKEICEDVISSLVNAPNHTIENMIRLKLKEHQVYLTNDQCCSFISNCVHIERTVSSYYRERILHAVANANISLSIYGDGWGNCDWISLPNVTYHKHIPPSDILKLMDDTKIVLNTMPWFKDGSHERIFNGMLHGAVILSDHSDYLDEVLPKDAWIPFSLDKEDIVNLPHVIQTLLSDSQLSQSIASNGFQHAVSNHTWKHRAYELHNDLLQYI